ncbi:MAG: CpsD/CapB family tyrosine-protein kinase [Candidatus Binatia bacterium]
MSRTYEALMKAERSRARDVGTNGANGNGHANGVGQRGRVGVDRHDPAHLEYEKIRVWLRHPSTNGDRLQTVMIVSCHSGTGSTTTAALLGTTLAEGKHSRVLIIDSNFRTPGMNLLFQVQNDSGLSDITTDGLPFEAEIQATDRKNLFVLSAGMNASPLDVFDGEAIEQLINELRSRFDYILFDAAPTVDFPDAYALAAKVDGIILVAEPEHTLIEEAQRTKRDLERAGGRILGVVLNRHKDFLPASVRRSVGAW